MRIAHLSDIHFGGENKQAVAAAAEWLHKEQPRLIAITGDVTRAGTPAEFDAAKAWCDSLPSKPLITPGNHDVPYYEPQRVFDPWGRYERAFGPARDHNYELPGLDLAAVNTARGAQPRANWSKGQISPGQIRRTAAAIAASDPHCLRVIACHHPLMEMVGGPMTGKVWNGRAAAEAFSKAHADLVLTGHVHAPFTLAYPFGDQKTYAVGASTLSLRERGVPIGFNCIEVDEKTIAVTAMAWTGSHFEPWRSWRVDRRERPPA
ncbi:MAG TPA: metallophosphoesterase [Caulobacteraceae bacterium]